MHNYEYIIAGLPALSQDGSGKIDAAGILAEIRSQLDARDNAAVSLLTDGWDSGKLNEAFYEAASRSGSRFIREYFDFDLHVRNTKVAWLNRNLGRPEDMDIMPGGSEDYDEKPAIEKILGTSDILARERGLDDAMWDKIDSLTVMDVFDLDVILGFIAKLKIVDRWLQLDEGTGRELFHKLVKEIKENYNI